MARHSQPRREAASSKRHVRCAIYTRKSTEEGLDQEFNSLDAQREACAAYIVSQRHEGWSLLPEFYDDGGYSGGNMERPGLKRLMAEVRAGRVDVIVVYKVDRLTRSLSDFSKIVDVLDEMDASFVSITQSFNTTTSMGRLTLNVLLSFAQFEREVISERVRDKIAASKAKGMWMGGGIPLGYDVVERKLIPNEAEAATIRHIMQRYLELGSVAALMADLKASDIRTKQTGERGGQHFVKGPLYYILQNRLYVGEITHHDKVYPGEHQGIVDRELFDAVQALLAKNAADRRNGVRLVHVSVLAGMIRDGYDRPMSPSHANKGSLRYRYYISNISVPGATNQPERILRLSAPDLECSVVSSLVEVFDAADPVRERWETLGSSGMDMALRRCSDLAYRLARMPSSECRSVLQELDLQIVVTDQAINGSIALGRFLKRIGVLADDIDAIERIPMSISTRTKTYGNELRMVFAPAAAKLHKRDQSLIGLLVEAAAARQQLIGQAYMEKPDANLARRELNRIARFTYLAPDIVSIIMDGRQPEDLTRRRLSRIGALPLCWEEQRKIIGLT